MGAVRKGTRQETREQSAERDTDALSADDFERELRVRSPGGDEDGAGRIGTASIDQQLRDRQRQGQVCRGFERLFCGAPALRQTEQETHSWSLWELKIDAPADRRGPVAWIRASPPLTPARPTPTLKAR